jgi:hypothetical protein
LNNSNPEWDEVDELKEFPNLADWYNKIMKSCEAYKSIKVFDTDMREKLDSRVVGKL